MLPVAVIMAGGAGERFWPASRGGRPKQLLRLLSDRTMIEEAVERIAPLIPAERVFIVLGEDIAPMVREVLGPNSKVTLLIEPARRNTTACLAFAAAQIERIVGPHVMAVLTADHLIRPAERFRDQVALALATAEGSREITLIGKAPTRPETGYGYMEVEPEPLASEPRGRVLRVRRFKEKPDRKTALAYVSAGNYLWNSGMFFWRSDVFAEALRNHCPAIGNHLSELASADAQTYTRAFLAFPSVAIDVAVLEKVHALRAVEAQFDWDDVGAWTALERVHPADHFGNVTIGTATLEGCRECIVYVDPQDAAQGVAPLVAMLGVHDLIVAVSGGRILVTTRDRAQDVKSVARRAEGEAGQGAE